MSAALALALLTSTAGHVGQDQFGKFPFVDGGVVTGGGTSWGLVRETPGAPGEWERVCEESFGPVVFFAVDQGARGVLLGGTDGMSRSTDGGCTYNPINNEVAGEFTSAFWNDPNNPEHMILATSTPTSQNAIWESNDGGDSFEVLRAPVALSYFNMAVSDDGQRIGVNGGDALGNPVLFLSDDAGASFVDVSDVVAGYPVVHALIFDGADLLLGGLQPSTQGFVDRIAFDGVSATSTRVGDAPREVKQAALFGGDLYIIANNGTRGELLIANESALGFGTIDGGPSDCVFVRDGVLVGCGKQVGLNTSLFMTSPDGATWTESVDFQDIHYQICPEGTIGRTACATFVELFCGDDIDNDFGGGTDCDDRDCDTNVLCLDPAGEGEGDGPVEGEGDGGEGEVSGEGEGDVVTADESCCTGTPQGAFALGGALLLVTRRRRRR